MFDTSSIRSNQDFDGFMVLSDGVLLTVSLLTRGTLVPLLSECETCSTLSDHVYVIAPVRVGDADAFHQCQTCLHESIQTADMSGDKWFAPLS